MAMIAASFFLPFALPTLNELEAARGRVALGRGAGDDTRWNAYNETKRRLQADIVSHVLAARVPKIEQGARVRLVFFWHCPDRRTDPDNIAAGGRKLIMDALARTRTEPTTVRTVRGVFKMPRPNVGAGVLHCDGWHCVAGFVDHFISEAERSRVGVRVQIEIA